MQELKNEIERNIDYIIQDCLVDEEEHLIIDSIKDYLEQSLFLKREWRYHSVESNEGFCKITIWLSYGNDFQICVDLKDHCPDLIKDFNWFKEGF